VSDIPGKNGDPGNNGKISFPYSTLRKGSGFTSSSTISKAIAELEQKGWTIQKEPLDKWPLKEFYEDPKRWAFYFHMVLLQTLQPKKLQKYNSRTFTFKFKVCLLASTFEKWHSDKNGRRNVFSILREIRLVSGPVYILV
jgi:deoxyadenosine/deoxycytidine kinase